MTSSRAGCHPKWDGTTFDHVRVTRVPLLKHGDLACTDCHPGRQYESPPTCSPCHEADRRYRQGDRM